MDNRATPIFEDKTPVLVLECFGVITSRLKPLRSRKRNTGTNKKKAKLKQWPIHTCFINPGLKHSTASFNKEDMKRVKNSDVKANACS